MNNYLHIKKGKNVKIGEGVIIKENVIIGNDVVIDDYARILSNVEIKDGSYIGSFSTIGDPGINYSNYKTKKTIIEKNALIRSHSVIYHDVKIGENFQCGHRVTIREKSDIGKNVKIGTLSDIQGHCTIGNYVNLHSNVHIGQKSIIEDFVWIFPYTVLTNDPTPPSDQLYGVTVKKFAVIATNSTILPGVKIEEDALIGANSLVNKNVKKGMIVVGNPLKEIGGIEKIKNKETGKEVYPWRYTFDRGMPWEKIGYKNWNDGRKN